MAKASKKTANYRAGTKSRHCGICTMFVAPHGCTAVNGRIDPDDLCDYFKLDRSTRRKSWYGESHGNRSEEKR